MATHPEWVQRAALPEVDGVFGATLTSEDSTTLSMEWDRVAQFAEVQRFRCGGSKSSWCQRLIVCRNSHCQQKRGG